MNLLPGCRGRSAAGASRRQRTGDGQLDGWSALYSEAADEREAFEQRLRLCWENEDDYDPLPAEIAAARDALLAAEARIRVLIAYGREFTRPRPYRLETWPGPPACPSPGCAPPTTMTRLPRWPG